MPYIRNAVAKALDRQARPRTIYIAGRFTWRRPLRTQRARVRASGFVCESSWLDAADGVPAIHHLKTHNVKESKRDLREIRDADLVIVDTRGEGGGGRFFEMGWAYAVGKPVWLVGPEVSVFDSLADHRFLEWDAVLRRLRKERTLEPAPKPAQHVTKADMAALARTTFEKSILPLLDAGQHEYAHGAEDNAFANFERVAEDLGTTREAVLWTYFRKHVDGIAAWIKGHRSQREDVRGRIDDAIVYLLLLREMAAGRGATGRGATTKGWSGEYFMREHMRSPDLGAS